MNDTGIEPQALAVVGLDAAWAGCAGQDSGGGAAFERMIYAGGQSFAPRGYRPQAGQASEWLVKSAARSLADAGIDPTSMRIAILYAGAVGDLSTLAGQNALLINLNGEANPLAAAVEAARGLLERGEAGAVVFAAASTQDFDWDSIPVADSNAMGFDRAAHGWRIGSGAGAVVFVPYAHALRDERRTYAVIKGLGFQPGAASSATGLPVAPLLQDVRLACQRALDEAAASPEQVGLVSAFACGVDALDGVEIAGLCQAYRGSGDLSTALGSAQANAGYLGAAAGLAGLVHAALCLYHRILPVAPGWSAPKLPALWRGSPFYVPSESKSWFAPNGGVGRLAGVNAVGRGGSFAHLVLSEDTAHLHRPNSALSRGGFLLFPIAGDSLADLLEQLDELRQALVYAHDLPALAAEWHDCALERSQAPYGLSLLGHNHDELLRESELAIKALPSAFEKGGEWQTPVGSCFSAQPAGIDGKVALVYPGAFNSYPWVAKDLFHLFPFLFSSSLGRTTDLGRVVRDRLLYPRSLTAPTKEEQAAYEAGLLSDPVAMLTSGTTVAILFTYVLQEAFQIPISAAFGYSLGENSMMYATRIWLEGDEATARLEQSDVFHRQLAGPQNAIRAAWGLPPVEKAGDEPLWNNYILMTSYEAARPAIEKESRVYLTHINAPRQIVIGGDPEACRRVIADLRCASLQAPFNYALHCAPMRSQFEGLAVLHDWPVERIPPMKLYSAADYRPLDLCLGAECGSGVSRKIAHMLTSPLDFPRLVNTVYEDGARVFIEAGAGSNCTRWVDESLKGRPHVALSVNRRGTDDYSSLLRLLARLYSHRVPMDLSALYESVRGKVTL